MKGMEQLIASAYYDRSKHGSRKLKPDRFGDLGMLRLGDTTLRVLGKFLDIDLSQASDYHPRRWHKPDNLALAKPDTLIVQDTSIIAVVENKASLPQDAAGIRKEVEQLQTYILACKARVGILTDARRTVWIHNLDPRRKNDLKIVKEQSRYCDRVLDPKNLEFILDKLDPGSDELAMAPALDPSALAKSVWQEVYIATRQNPEKCFQTFVDLFMYKLLSDYDLLPKNMLIGNLACDASAFMSKNGKFQIEYYLETIRPEIKAQLFIPMTTSERIVGLVAPSGEYVTSKALIPSLDTAAGMTSVIDGHAFEKQPAGYNDAFIRILKKLNSFPKVTRLERTFKSRIYEQFLRRDPNTSKVTGKYFTPRNVVQAIVQMAEIHSTPRNTVIGDPACGVGGFITESLLELQRWGIENYRPGPKGEIVVERKFVGLEVLQDVVCLAKANMLLHCIELYSSLSNTAKRNFTKLVADVFIHCHEDITLGSLKHSCSGAFDIIMANPPYIVSGTQTVTTKLHDSENLGDFYDAGGAGLESKFVNWMINALKPGGRCFVILPKSMLARVNKRFKAWILKKCILDALVYLPTNTFYTTPNPTYIVAITRKHNENMAQVDPVYSYYVRDTGETRDTKRESTRNDLIDMAHEFLLFKASKDSYEPATDFCKVVPVNQLGPDKRWDVDFNWSPQELANLGVVDTNVKPYKAVVADLKRAEDDIVSAAKQISGLVTKPGSSKVKLSLADEKYFKIHRGHRITKKQCQQHPGDVPVVSSGRHVESYLGTVAEAYVRSQGFTLFENKTNVMTVGATGAVGSVHLRKEPKWFLHDDALAVEVCHASLMPNYVRCALQHSINIARFEYTAKLFAERLKALEIDVPVDKTGLPDKVLQEQIAEAYERKEAVESRLKELAEHLRDVAVEFD